MIKGDEEATETERRLSGGVEMAIQTTRRVRLTSAPDTTTLVRGAVAKHFFSKLGFSTKEQQHPAVPEQSTVEGTIDSRVAAPNYYAPETRTIPHDEGSVQFHIHIRITKN